MRYLKYALLTAAVAAIGAGAASSASAAVLCTTNANCTTSHNGGGGQMYDKGDTISASAANPEITTSAGNIVCKTSEMKFKLTNTGAPGTLVAGEITIDFNGCIFKGAINCANLHFEGYPGTVSLGTAPNGTLTGFELFVPFICIGGIECWLGAKDLKLPLTGGNPATLVATKLPLERKEPALNCPESAELDATYKTATPVYVYSG
jgi:hypothetical protein